MSDFYQKFIPQVLSALEIQYSFRLRNWVAQEHYFDMLSTPVLETLNQQTLKRIQAGGRFEELQSLFSHILLRRYLLGWKFSAFDHFTADNGIEVPLPLREVIDNWKDEGKPLERQKKLIEVLVNLECDSSPFKSVRADIRARFIKHRQSVNVVVTVEGSSHSLVRKAISFLIASNKDRKVFAKSDIFLSSQGIDSRFLQAEEEIQIAMPLKTRDGIRYWYQLDLFQKLVRDNEIRLDGLSASAAIGWLIFGIEKDIVPPTPLLSIWGAYDAYGDRFRPVDGLRDKLDACLEDGIRIVVVPQATGEKQIETGTPFNVYAQQQGMHVIPFPDDMPILEVYPFLLAKCQELGLIRDGPKPQPARIPTNLHAQLTRFLDRE